MKHIFTIFILFLSFQIFSQNKQISTYYLIRHAEKVKSESADPVLHADGEKRAAKWAEIFSDIPFDAVYSTNYIRTMETARPTANSQKLDIINYHPIKIDYQKFVENTKGKTVLIVGHSNTIPGFVNKLIGVGKYGTPCFVI